MHRDHTLHSIRSLAITHASQAPRSLDPHLAHSFGSVTGARLHRVVHHRDIVPHVPAQKFGYAHVAREYYYDGSHSSAHVCDGTGEDRSCSDQFGLSYLNPFNLKRGVLDHSIESGYLASIPIVPGSGGALSLVGAIAFARLSLYGYFGECMTGFSNK